MWIININRLPEQMFEMVIRKPCKSNFLMENVRAFTCELPFYVVVLLLVHPCNKFQLFDADVAHQLMELFQKIQDELQKVDLPIWLTHTHYLPLATSLAFYTSKHFFFIKMLPYATQSQKIRTNFRYILHDSPCIAYASNIESRLHLARRYLILGTQNINDVVFIVYLYVTCCLLGVCIFCV